MPTTHPTPTSNLPHLDIPVSVTYTHSLRAKHLRITIKPTKTITVTVPRRTTQKQAQKFLLSEIPWIKKQLQKIEQQTPLIDPPDLTIDLDKAQNELFHRLDYFSNKYNLPYNRAAFRCQKTKWGSCSSKNNISLNVNIAYLPAELQDYLLLHELVHTKIKNHSREYGLSWIGM